MPHDRLTIVFSGMLAGVPGQGGATWAALQYVLGLRQLGHTVYVVEPVAAQAAPYRAHAPALGGLEGLGRGGGARFVGRHGGGRRDRSQARSAA